MVKFFFRFLLLISILTIGGRLQAQVNFYNMNKWQDSLLMLGKDMYRLKGEAERLEKNFTFVKSLVSALKEKHSYMYNFEKLNMISVVKAPDDRFRIFSWNIPLNDGSYLYYGAIQTKTKDGKLDLVPLLDKTFWVENPDSDILKPDHWYGAQYYDIVSMGDAYVLLGWKGHEPTYTQKVIEILHFENGVYSLGKKVFSDNPIWSRRIFKYTSQASMYLKYHKDKNSFIFDHIVPAAPNLVGKFAYYGPDLTYDAYVIEQGKLVLKSNIPFQNPPREEDHLNIVPGKAIPKKVVDFRSSSK